MSARLATDVEIKTWREEGWILLDGLIGTDEIDAASDDLRLLYPTPEDYHADPQGVTERWKGRPAQSEEDFVWPDEGVGFRPEQHVWNALFPFPGSGALNRLLVHPSLVDFAERALGSEDIRLYQAQASAKYSGSTNFEQPMHIDRNHSWLPAGTESPWWNLQGFLYLSDVTEAANPTRLVPLAHSGQVTSPYGVVLPEWDPELYGAERPAPGVRGSFLAYRSNVYHRGAPFGSPGTARFTVGICFKHAGQDWIGYDQQQSRSTGPDWTRFVEGSTPRELELFGFPPPGHPVWDEGVLEKTALRYPELDLEPWRAKLGI
jgi:hypothetical protein